MKKALALAALVLASLPHPARADDDACAKAAEEGQRARRDGDAHRARERFVACSAETCTASMQRDCTQWTRELDAPRGHSAMPWVVAGVGGALVVTGVLLFVLAPTAPKNCDASSGACTKTPGESDAQLAKDKDDANTNTNDQKLGLIALIAGGFFLVSGLAWHFLEPTGPATASRGLPWAFTF
ncbi:MAG TPA: hypothetical protein VIF62_01475 [Labilithrix sp.]